MLNCTDTQATEGIVLIAKEIAMDLTAKDAGKITTKSKDLIVLIATAMTWVCFVYFPIWTDLGVFFLSHLFAKSTLVLPRFQKCCQSRLMGR